MPKLNTTVKSVRIDNDKLERLERKLGGRTINSWLNEKIEEEVEGIKIAKDFLPSAMEEELGSMAGFFAMSADELLDGIFAGLREGYLTVEEGKVVGVPEVDLDEFKKVSKFFNRTPDEMMRDVIKGLKRTGRY